MKRNTLNTFITATLIMLLGVSSSAQAIVPAGDLMGKTSVTFFGKDAEVRDIAVSVPLIPSAPEITRIEGDESGDWIIKVTKRREITYAVTATANGPDTYTLTAEYDEATSEDVGPPTLSISPDNPPLELGATAAIRIVGRTITVPYDKEGGLDSVNGISEGETVVIGGTSYPVASVRNIPNSEDPTATILLGGADSAPDISLGTPITERRTFIVTVSDVELAGEDEGTAGIKITATRKTDVLIKSEHSFEFVVLAPVEPSFEKYVRNVTTPEEIAIEDDDIRGHENNNFYRYGVSADEGNVLEYLIVLNAGNQGPQTDIVLNETLSPFVEYVQGSSRIDGGGDFEGEAFWWPEPSVALQNRNFTNQIGLPPLNIAKNTSAHITYQVKVIGGDGDDDGGDGGDGQWATNDTDCSYNEDTGLWKPDSGNNATKCKGVKWNAANGIDVANNPVCWDRKSYDGWQEDGVNPWVVGTAAERNDEAYDCRTKCAGKSGDSFGHCATDGWWEKEAATSTECAWDGRVGAYIGVDIIGAIVDGTRVDVGRLLFGLRCL